MNSCHVQIETIPPDDQKRHAGDSGVINGFPMEFLTYRRRNGGAYEVWCTPKGMDARRSSTAKWNYRQSKLRSAANCLERAIKRMGAYSGFREKRIAFHISKGRSVADIVVREGWPASMVLEIYNSLIALGNSVEAKGAKRLISSHGKAEVVA